MVHNEEKILRAILKYRLDKRSSWKAVVGEDRRPKIYACKRMARIAAIQFKRRNVRRPFYFRVEEAA